MKCRYYSLNVLFIPHCITCLLFRFISVKAFYLIKNDFILMMAGLTPKHVNKRLAVIFEVVSYKQDFSIEVLITTKVEVLMSFFL